MDITGLELFINDTLAMYQYEDLGDDVYKIIYTTKDKYFYGAMLSVNVAAKDKSKHKNIIFDFWTITFSNSIGPLVDMENALPKRCSRGISVREDNIIFQIYAINGTGLDEQSISVQIAGKNFDDKVILLPIIYNKS